MRENKCGFCGESFDNVFEAVDHLDEEFNPNFIVSETLRLKIGDLLYEVYQKGNAELKELAEMLFSSIYIAEKRPEILTHVLDEHNHELKHFVYDIITEDSWELAGQGK